jgi:hypothetical protein
LKYLDYIIIYKFNIHIKLANYLNALTDFVNIANNNIINNQLLIFNGPNGNISINELRDQLRNREDWIRMKTYILTTIDYILFHTSGLIAQYINGYVEELNNKVNNVNNMIFLPQDDYILYMIMNVVNNSTRDQKKEIFNIFSALI